MDEQKTRSRSIVNTEAVRIAIPRTSMGQEEVEWLRNLSSLNYDVFGLATATNDRPLQFLAKAVLLNTGVLEKVIHTLFVYIYIYILRPA